jgi:hypothetical protein
MKYPLTAKFIIESKIFLDKINTVTAPSIYSGAKSVVYERDIVDVDIDSGEE